MGIGWQGARRRAASEASGALHHCIEKSFKQIFIFTPTIDLSVKVYKFLRLFFRNGYYINSHSENRDEIIKKFRVKKYRYLVTTAVLERGVTVKDLQVIVYHADHPIYDSYSLIQIAGRAGRKKEAPEGEEIGRAHV